MDSGQPYMSAFVVVIPHLVLRDKEVRRSKGQAQDCPLESQVTVCRTPSLAALEKNLTESSDTDVSCGILVR
jgi:hypothetical protein